MIFALQKSSLGLAGTVINKRPGHAHSGKI